jgi:transposase-like protein
MEEKAYEKDEIMGDERARRGSESPIIFPSSEVKEKVNRRRFTESYKQRVLQKVAELRQEGGGKIGEFVRKEGLYYSTVQKWEKSIIANKSINKKISTKNQDLQNELVALKKQLKKANKKLKKAEMIIEIQKKISILMEKPENK